MRFKARVATALLLIIVQGSAARAETGAWDHVGNIKDAAGRLATLHRRQGSPGVLKFLDACYRTHLLASSFSQGLEACMAQDYMHTQVLATIYSKISAEERTKLGAPSPELIAQGMGQRFVAAYAQYKVALAEAEDFKKLVDKHGFPVFLKAVFPKSGNQPPDGPKSGGEK